MKRSLLVIALLASVLASPVMAGLLVTVESKSPTGPTDYFFDLYVSSTPDLEGTAVIGHQVLISLKADDQGEGFRFTGVGLPSGADQDKYILYPDLTPLTVYTNSDYTIEAGQFLLSGTGTLNSGDICYRVSFEVDPGTSRDFDIEVSTDYTNHTFVYDSGYNQLVTGVSNGVISVVPEPAVVLQLLGLLGTGGLGYWYCRRRARQAARRPRRDPFFED